MVFNSEEEAEEAIIDALLRGVRDWGEEAFKLSQDFVPVVKGTLKSSAEFKITTDGVKIVYHAPYAWVRENVVPKKTAQVDPRGTHYVQRAQEKADLVDSIVISLKRLE
jgi:hypothetical protein